MQYSAEFRCFAGCEGAWPVTEPIYRCPKCGGLLEVVHDLEALRDRSGAAWMKLFDDRYLQNAWPYGSGVWGKHEWVMPQMPDDMIVSMYEGGTNLFWADRYGKQIGVDDLWVKLCGNSHSGSFKDLGMTVLVSVVRLAMQTGLKVKAIACASTGDTSASLAAYGAAAGLPVVVLLPRGKISTAQLVQPLAHGALVLGLDTDFDGCMAIVQRLAEEGMVYLANSMNPLRLEGQKTVAIEIVQQFDWQMPDWMVLPSGNLGNASAFYAGFQHDARARRDRALSAARRGAGRKRKPARIAPGARASARSTPIQAKPTQATAIQIGNPVSAPRAIRALEALNGIVEQASEQELARPPRVQIAPACTRCPHTAVGLAVLEKLVARGVIQRAIAWCAFRPPTG